MTALRPYQERAIADLRAAYAAGRRAPCLVLPTGGGKTIAAADVIRSAVDRGKRVLFLAHRAELLAQTVAKLSAAGVSRVRLIQAANDVGDPMDPVTVASVQTLTADRWLDRIQPPDLIVCDEAHHFVAQTFARIPARYPRALLLGMTATPQRGDGRALGDIFDALVIGSTVRELTALGHLVPCRVWAPPVPLDAGQLALDVADAYAKHGNDERAVVFCGTREHAAAICASLPVSSIVVHGSMGVSARREALARFRAGEIRVVANVHVLTEGFDDPAIAVCILARKLGHAGTFLQAVGRVLRPAPGKASATLIDLCGSVLEHGLPDMDREFTLDGKGISTSEREPVRQCPTCGAVFLAAGSTGTCPQCGATLPSSSRVTAKSVGCGVVDVTGMPAPVRKYVVELVAKYPSVCGSPGCTRRIATGDAIHWVKGEKPRHAFHVRDVGLDDALGAADALLAGVA